MWPLISKPLMSGRRLSGPNVYLGLGSNLGDRHATIHRAIETLSKHPECEVITLSDLYETDPTTLYQQPKFINGVAHIKTLLTPQALLTLCEDIEKQLGRTEKGNWDPRTIDIDILLYDDRVISTDTLMIPHPLMHVRDFVLMPFMDIDNTVQHPLLGKTVKELYDELPQV